MLNSLDAGARHIDVQVDCRSFKLSVLDDGVGIPWDDFELLGTRHATSKCESLDELSTVTTFGYRSVFFILQSYPAQRHSGAKHCMH